MACSNRAVPFIVERDSTRPAAVIVAVRVTPACALPASREDASLTVTTSWLLANVRV
ncbi:hypothetical protein COSO111634_08260 [Corallococcus soli]